jgi:hypothetical protein
MAGFAQTSAKGKQQGRIGLGRSGAQIADYGHRWPLRAKAAHAAAAPPTNEMKSCRLMLSRSPLAPASRPYHIH